MCPANSVAIGILVHPQMFVWHVQNALGFEGEQEFLLPLINLGQTSENWDMCLNSAASFLAGLCHFYPRYAATDGRSTCTLPSKCVANRQKFHQLQYPGRGPKIDWHD
eukprot:80358-Rhodomonas_salina.1